jgi:FAD:protein FMN transferase
MKKILLVLFVIGITFSLFACKKELSPYTMIFSYMGTETEITIYLKNKNDGDVHREHIDAIYAQYHELSDYLGPLPATSIYKENIYTINQKPEQDIQIDRALYDLLVQAEAYRILTNGYFDISVGAIVSAWKHLTESHLLEVIPEEAFLNTIEQIEALDRMEDAITLWTIDEDYFIKIKNGVKLDPGAITKGYATELAKDYLINQEIEYYTISGGSSSISLGKNYNRDTGLFHVALQNPIRTGIDDRTYGIIYVNHTGVTTSGNYVQYALYENLRYHHIVSPFSKMPMHYYHTVTVIGENLGLMDAVSTALFNMDPETFDAWMALNQATLNIEVVRFNYDASITTFLNETIFEER